MAGYAKRFNLGREVKHILATYWPQATLGCGAILLMGLGLALCKIAELVSP